MTRKKLLMLLGSVCLALMMVLPVAVGCAGEAPAPATPAEPSQQVITWHYHTHGALNSAAVVPVAWWADLMEERTDGRFRIVIHPLATLLPTMEAPEGLRDNVAQMAYIAPPYYPSKLPLGDGLFLPALTSGLTPETASKWQTECFSTPSMVGELDKWNAKFLFPLAMGGYQIIGNVPIRKLEDLKGVKVRAVSWHAKLMEKLGATAVSIGYRDAYSGLDTGLIDLMMAPAGYVQSYNWTEVSDYWTDDFNIVTQHCGQYYAVNNDAWNALPKDIQDIIIESIPEFTGKQLAVSAEKEAAIRETIKQLVEEGKMEEYIHFPIEEHMRMKNIAEAEVWPEWIEFWEDKGQPAQEFLEAATELRDKYQ